MEDCVFCRIVAGQEPAKVVARWEDVIAIVPLNPVTEGHVLVIPNAHVRDATEDPIITASVMARAAYLAKSPCNIITSAGEEATQTVFHLHVHIVPRRKGDGLHLPWTPRQEEKASIDVPADELIEVIEVMSKDRRDQFEESVVLIQKGITPNKELAEKVIRAAQQTVAEALERLIENFISGRRK